MSTRDGQRTNPGEQLDSQNARLRRRRSPATAIRRRLEANIEAKYRRRRSQQGPASAMLGGSISKRG